MKSKLKSKKSKFCLLETRLDGKVALVTGANRGIGLETTAELARRGAIVLMCCRNQTRAEAAKAKILEWYGEGQPEVKSRNVASPEMAAILTPVKPEQLSIIRLNLCSSKSITSCANILCEVDATIDILINNAGIMACSYATTEDGIESQMGVNFLGHYHLTTLLLPCLLRSEYPARIVTISSVAQKPGQIPEELNMPKETYSPLQAYRNSKLATLILAKQLASYLDKQNIMSVSCHPGVVKTLIWRGKYKYFKDLGKPWMKSPWEGTQTTLYCVLATDLTNGGYYKNSKVKTCNPLADDTQVCERLWKWAEETTGVQFTKLLRGITNEPDESEASSHDQSEDQAGGDTDEDDDTDKEEDNDEESAEDSE